MLLNLIYANLTHQMVLFHRNIWEVVIGNGSEKGWHLHLKKSIVIVVSEQIVASGSR